MLSINKKFRILLLGVTCLFLILFNIGRVSGVEWSGEGEPEPLKETTGNVTCDNPGQYEGFVRSLGFRLVVLTKGGERIISDSYDFYHFFTNDWTPNDIKKNGYGRGNGCSKIEYILGNGSCSPKNRIYVKVKDNKELGLSFPDEKVFNANWHPRSNSLTVVFDYLEDNDYANLRTMLDYMGYDCDAESIINATAKNDKNDKCYIDNVNETYVSVEPMLLFNYGGYRYDTAYEMGRFFECYLGSQWSFLAGFKGSSVKAFDGSLINKFSQVAPKDAIDDLGTYNGVMAYKISDIIDIPKTGKLEIIKKGTGVSGEKKLKGATFYLYKLIDPTKSATNDNLIYVTSLTTGSDGTVGKELEIGTYALKEITSPAGYEIDKATYEDGWIDKNINISANRVVTITVFNKEIEGELTIHKIDVGTGNLLNGAHFRLWKGIGCTGTQVEGYTDFTVYGSFTIRKLQIGGYYSLEEIAPPPDYAQPKPSCVVSSIKINQVSSSIDIPNDNSCPAIFSGLNKDSMEDRIWAYNFFLNGAQKKDYNGLLNLANDTADTACKHYDCTPSTSNSCLSGSYGAYTTTFNSSNLSCFNEKFDYDGTTVFCLNTFDLVNKVGGSNFGKVTAGQVALQKIEYSDAIAATGTVTKKCFTLSPNLSINDKYSNYVESVSLDNKKLQTKDASWQEQKDNNLTGGFNSDTNLFEYSASVNYYLNPVYAKIGTGEPTESSSNNATKLGYGVLLPFDVNDYKEQTYNIPFSIKFKNDIFGKLYDSSTYTNQCSVETKPEVVKENKLKLEFRIIDTNNPFPGISGESDRLVGSNWRSVSLDFDLNTLQSKISTGFTSVEDFKYDINKDGKLDEKDSKYYDWLKDSNNFDTKHSSNPYIAYIMENTNNSYDKDGTGPKYTITLTPDNIKKIREYNVTHKYDDFTLNCTNGDNCKMDEFSSYLNQIGVTIKTN